MLPVWLALFLLPVLGGAERFNCRGRILGAYYADAKSGCKAFHVCVRVAGGGIRDFRFFCPPGTLFHQEAQTCTDWGDDDPLACPAEIYDGQFDLYKIGSGFDTKKLSSPGNRDEESEFGLQRAETGDRRLSQNNGASDLRAAHSSDFFSGQRDRGRDDSAPAPTPQRTSQYQPPQQQQPQHHAHHNQQPQNKPPQNQQPQNQQQQHQQPQHQQPQHQPSQQKQQQHQQFAQQPASHASRQSFRRPTTRAPPPTTQYTNPPPSPPPQPPVPQQYENSKRKLVRKRPVYVSPSTPAPQTTFAQNTQPPQNYPEQAPQQVQQNYNRRVPQNRQTIPPVNVPPQYKEYKDEYVEVSRVTPKPNKYFQSKTPAPFTQSTPAPTYNKNNKDGLVELYNYDAQSTPGLNSQNDNRPFKVRNSFSVSEQTREPDYARSNNINSNKGTPTTVDYNPPSRGTASTPAFKNFNSVSYEPEKNNFVPYSKQQNFFSSPSTTPATTFYTTTFRPEPPLNLNTVAYNTNIGFGNTQESNYAESDEDDGQYRPPQGEDDGQYRPELYDRELLSGAHSLNIAASGNRLPEDQKPRGKTKAPFKTTPHNSQTTFKASQTPYKPVSQTAAPRPFRPAPTLTSTPAQRAPETYPTTLRPQTQPQTQRTFDYFQTYTTTSRPTESSAAPVSYNLDSVNNFSSRPTSTLAPRNPEPRQQSHAPPVPTAPPAPAAPLRPTTRPPFFSNPVSNKEDNSYDYAYYDSDPGFSEYDHIEEFGKTKTKKA